MTESLNPAASHHLPSFITAPGETDVLMVIMIVVVFFSVMMFGILFFRLHTLPERVAHKSQKVQFEIVAVLGLISLFTHMHIFWIIGLLLALVDLPDFGTPLRRIAHSAEKLAGITASQEAAEMPVRAATPMKQERSEAPGKAGHSQKTTAALMKAEIGSAAQKEIDHA